MTGLTADEQKRLNDARKVVGCGCQGCFTYPLFALCLFATMAAAISPSKYGIGVIEGLIATAIAGGSLLFFRTNNKIVDELSRKERRFREEEAKRQEEEAKRKEEEEAKQQGEVKQEDFDQLVKRLLGEDEEP